MVVRRAGGDNQREGGLSSPIPPVLHGALRLAREENASGGECLWAGVQLNTTIQAQTLARVEGNLVEHETSIEKVANAIGAGFARVDEDLEQMGENVNLVRANVDSIDCIHEVCSRVSGGPGETEHCQGWWMT